ncbi:MAG: hypothetical protein [Bacteriophage sp.]|nr:MAG: hypothetical protein [Bacteriophage sp.]
MTHSIISCVSLSGSVVALVIAMVYMTQRDEPAYTFYAMIASFLLVIAVLTM